MEQVDQAKQVIDAQRKELRDLVSAAQQTGIEVARERLKRWKARTVDLLRQYVHQEEGARFAEKKKTSFAIGNPLGNLADEARMYDGFLHALDDELQRHPESVMRPARPVPDQPIEVPAMVPTASTVFIVHGHDELNVLRFKELLRERWRLEPLVLSTEPGRGRTLIEKFEEEAQRATFAFVLISSDDQVSTTDGAYYQARPNVVFKLGWFYGRLGRDRVCILFKKGTKLHSDLDGISRVEFESSVSEKIDEIERELVTAKVLRKGGEDDL